MKSKPPRSIVCILFAHRVKRLTPESTSFKIEIKSAFSFLVIMYLVLGITRSLATQLIWDPSQNGSGNAGSGNWDTTAGNTNWYNGSADVVWSQTSATAPLNGATFGGPDAAPGTYMITNDAVQVAVTNLTINNS